MSKKKLYAVKNDEGEWMSLDGTQTEIWYANNPTLFKDKSYAEAQSMGRKAHVVELVEPEKVVLTEEQAKIVDDAHEDIWPATYISSLTDSSEQRLVIEAYVNGYTVANEKKYNVKVPHVPLYYWKKPDGGLGIDDLNVATADDDTDDFEFTESEIEQYGLQDCEKVWCDSDD